MKSKLFGHEYEIAECTTHAPLGSCMVAKIDGQEVAHFLLDDAVRILAEKHAERGRTQ